jgi:hypothetical protein
MAVSTSAWTVTAAGAAGVAVAGTIAGASMPMRRAITLGWPSIDRSPGCTWCADQILENWRAVLVTRSRRNAVAFEWVSSA